MNIRLLLAILLVLFATACSSTSTEESALMVDKTVQPTATKIITATPEPTPTLSPEDWTALVIGTPTEEAAPMLPSRPDTGAYWMSGDDSDNYEIVNDTPRDALVVLVYTVSPDAKRPDLVPKALPGTQHYIYVRAGESYVANDVFRGIYQIYVMFGEEWYPSDGAFSGDTSYWLLSDLQGFTSCSVYIYSGTTGPCDETIQLTLSEVIENGLTAAPISAAEFPTINLE